MKDFVVWGTFVTENLRALKEENESSMKVTLKLDLEYVILVS